MQNCIISKKENIGLIEVMGLAVLPARLKDEMAELADALVNGTDLRATETLASHAEWAEGFLPKYDKITKDNVMDILHEEIGLVFNEVLQDAGVYKCTPEGRKAFERFYCSCLVAFSGRYKFSQCDGRKRIFSFYSKNLQSSSGIDFRFFV